MLITPSLKPTFFYSNGIQAVAFEKLRSLENFLVWKISDISKYIISAHRINIFCFSAISLVSVYNIFAFLAHEYIRQGIDDTSCLFLQWYILVATAIFQFSQLALSPRTHCSGFPHCYRTEILKSVRKRLAIVENVLENTLPFTRK